MTEPGRREARLSMSRDVTFFGRPTPNLANPFPPARMFSQVRYIQLLLLSLGALFSTSGLHWQYRARGASVEPPNLGLVWQCSTWYFLKIRCLIALTQAPYIWLYFINRNW